MLPSAVRERTRGCGPGSVPAGAKAVELDGQAGQPGQGERDGDPLGQAQEAAADEGRDRQRRRAHRGQNAVERESPPVAQPPGRRERGDGCSDENMTAATSACTVPCPVCAPLTSLAGSVTQTPAVTNAAPIR